MERVDIQGHRGARGLAPENTLAGFLKALEIGVSTLEMDAVISADRRVVLSHEPWFSSEICSGPDGTPVTREEERGLILFRMPYARIKEYDCGSRGHPRFTRQQAEKSVKPLLHDVIRAAEVYRVEQGIEPFQYSVEAKSWPDGDGVYHPDPETFVRLIRSVLQEEDVLGRSIIQSFDVRALQAARALDSAWRTSLLIDDQGDRGLEENLRILGFVPTIYSPDHRLVDEALVAAAHEKGMQVIPWTVNDARTMQHLVGLGVEGIITDYPDIAVAALAQTEG